MIIQANVALIVGSLRENFLNRCTANALTQLAPSGLRREIVEIGQLPLYNQDLDDEGNGGHYGGGLTVEQTATADDGRLDFYSLEVDHWWRLLALLPRLCKGTRGRWDDVRAFETTEVFVKTSKPRAVNTDGELTTWTPAHFRIREKAIRVLAPGARTSG